jgi:hypothetical protein
MKETDLYEPVKIWLEHKGYKVYPEVCHRTTRADVVGIKDDCTVIVELKTSLSLELISQGVDWIQMGAANEVYVAVPEPQKSILRYTQGLLRREGLGLLLVNPNSYRQVKCSVGILPRKLDISRSIAKSITPFHDEVDIQGGHSGGGYMTGYRATMMGIYRYLSDSPGWHPLDGIMNACPTHYTGNARASTAKALKEFESKWCESKVISRKLHFRHKKGAKFE